VRGVDARAAAVIRIDAMWLAVEPVDMRAGADRLLARAVQVFGSARARPFVCDLQCLSVILNNVLRSGMAPGPRNA